MSVLQRLQSHIEAAMARPAAGEGLLTPLGMLSACAAVYGGVVSLRNRLYAGGVLGTRRLPCRVISVGNLTVGGTGKTPMTIYVAETVASMGYRTAVLSRGYGGQMEKTGGTVSDGLTVGLSAEDAGDEPYMMARDLPGIPVLVGRDRYAAGMRAVRRFHTAVAVLDDGFQHRRLQRDIDLLLLDARRPFGNHALLPRGPLREPPRSLARSSAVIFVSPHGGADAGVCRPVDPATGRLLRTRPVFRAVKKACLQGWIPGGKAHGPAAPPGTMDVLSGLRIFAFSGIGDNSAFFETLLQAGARVVGTARFADHHRYRPEELQTIFRQAARCRADLLATTRKDHVRLPPVGALPMDMAVVGVKISFGEEAEAFRRFLSCRISSPGKESPPPCGR